mmetsp:Transcript_54920/g.158920  ORF Transcript_54920/g.158920 Transcript_54920/m.158920 type:complete len:225 (+) Transcript_54920:1398-2072(+)
MRRHTTFSALLSHLSHSTTYKPMSPNADSRMTKLPPMFIIEPAKVLNSAKPVPMSEQNATTKMLGNATTNKSHANWVHLTFGHSASFVRLSSVNRWSNSTNSMSTPRSSTISMLSATMPCKCHLGPNLQTVSTHAPSQCKSSSTTASQSASSILVASSFTWTALTPMITSPGQRARPASEVLFQRSTGESATMPVTSSPKRSAWYAKPMMPPSFSSLSWKELSP